MGIIYDCCASAGDVCPQHAQQAAETEKSAGWVHWWTNRVEHHGRGGDAR